MHARTAISPNMQIDQMIAAARDISSTLPARLAETNRRRDIHPEVISALREAGLFRLLKPARFGGQEADPRLFYDIQNILAEECLSTAWVFGVLSIQSFALALFDPAAQADVWGDGSDTLISSSFKPEGKVTPVDGGYRISGQWTFSSGSSHADWALIGGLVPPASEGGVPEMRLFLVPRSDYAIIDTWHTFGLRGTGSNDLQLTDAFVPAHRTWTPTAGITTDARIDLPPLFRLPWQFMFTSCISNLAIGAGRGAIKRLGSMIAAMPSASAELAKAALGRASSEVEAANTLLHTNMGHFLDHSRAGKVMPLPQALLYRSQLTSMLRSIAQQVDTLMLLTGGRGISEAGPLTQTWLDLNAARHHMGNIPGPAEQALADSLIAGT